MSVAPLPELPERFTPLRVLGEGGMGMVLLAEDRDLRRQVAIKFLHQVEGDLDLARFEREARRMADLSHPNLAKIYDFYPGEDTPFLVMEYIAGGDLSSKPPPDPLGTMLEVGEALAALHSIEVLHRDIKPANLVRSPNGRVVLVDLGIARSLNEPRLTQTGEVVGTPSFLAPELLLGDAGSTASDWYAWGMTLYSLIEGAPSAGSEYLACLLLGEPLPPLERGKIVPGSPEDRVILACTQRRPEARPSGLTAIRNLASNESEAAPTDLSLTASTPSVRPVALPRPKSPSTPAPEQGRTGMPSRRLLGVCACVGAFLVAASGDFGRRPEASDSIPSSTPSPLKVPTGGPSLPNDLKQRLQDELALALQRPYSGSHRNIPRSGVRFRMALDLLGVMALDTLPNHCAVLDWIEGGGALADLSRPQRDALTHHEAELGDLGVPPAFAPLLATLESLQDPPVRPPEGSRLRPAFSECLEGLKSLATASTDAAGRRWASLAAAQFRAAAEAIEEVSQQAKEWGGLPALMTNGEGNGEILGALVSRRGDPAGRDGLRDLFRPGVAATRSFLVAAHQALERVPPASGKTALIACDKALQALLPLLGVDLLAASRPRLFGHRSGSSLGRTFEAIVLRHLRLLRQRVGMASGESNPEGLRAWEEVIHGNRALPEPLRSWVLGIYLGELAALGLPAKLGAALDRHRPLLGSLRGPRKKRLRDAITRWKLGTFPELELVKDDQ